MEYPKKPYKRRGCYDETRWGNNKENQKEKNKEKHKENYKENRKEEQKGKYKENQKGKYKENQKGNYKENRKENYKENRKRNYKEMDLKNYEGTIKKAGKKGSTSVKMTVDASKDCPVFKRCGGCQYRDVPYKEQLKKKQKMVNELLKSYCPVHPITGMEHPEYYRNKVSAAFGRLKNGTYISGIYEENSHRIVPIETCRIEDQKADEIIKTIRDMLKSFKIKTYDEDTGYGLLRHVLVRVGKSSGQIMVVLVTASPVFPSKNNFVKALRKAHPEITTIVINVNDCNTSMVLGNREINLYGKGYIEDTLCGYTFKISAKSFYQINPVQTEKLYNKAIQLAGLTGKERIIDAYCGIGTIGIIASPHVKEVISVELNGDAVKDAIWNARKNNRKNVTFYKADAGMFMTQMAEQGERVDVVFMDPPRSGSDESFLSSVLKLSPEKIVYISCGPDTLARDLKYLTKYGYKAEGAWPFDMFPATAHVESVVLMVRKP